jgi:hypothetical protein
MKSFLLRVLWVSTMTLAMLALRELDVIPSATDALVFVALWAASGSFLARKKHQDLTNYGEEKFND